MKVIVITRACAYAGCSFGVRSEGTFHEQADLTAEATEVAKDLAEELGILPSALTVAQRSEIRARVRHRLRGAGAAPTILTALLETQYRELVGAQLDAAMIAHGHPLSVAKPKPRQKTKRKAQ